MNNASERHKQILIMGNVATGKSTLMDKLTASILFAGKPAQAVPADELYRTNPFFERAVADRVKWSLTSDLWFLEERLKISREFQHLLASTFLVVDSGLPMSLVYAHSRIESGFYTPEQWQAYQDRYQAQVTSEFLPDVVIYLTAPIALQLERIKQRGREFEIKNHTEAYLKSLANSLNFVVTQLRAQEVPVVEATSSEVQTAGDAFVTQFLREHVLRKQK